MSSIGTGVSLLHVSAAYNFKWIDPILQKPLLPSPKTGVMGSAGMTENRRSPQDTLVKTAGHRNEQFRQILIVLRLCYIYFYLTVGLDNDFAH